MKHKIQSFIFLFMALIVSLCFYDISSAELSSIGIIPPQFKDQNEATAYRLAEEYVEKRIVKCGDFWYTKAHNKFHPKPHYFAYNRPPVVKKTNIENIHQKIRSQGVEWLGYFEFIESPKTARNTTYFKPQWEDWYTDIWKKSAIFTHDQKIAVMLRHGKWTIQETGAKVGQISCSEIPQMSERKKAEGRASISSLNQLTQPTTSDSNVTPPPIVPTVKNVPIKISSTPMGNTDWYLVECQIPDFYVKKNSFLYTNQSTIIGWISVPVPKILKQIFGFHPKSNILNGMNMVTKLEVNCRNKTMRKLHVSAYHANGKKVQEDNNISDWVNISEEENDLVTHAVFCSNR